MCTVLLWCGRLHSALVSCTQQFGTVSLLLRGPRIGPIIGFPALLLWRRNAKFHDRRRQRRGGNNGWARSFQWWIRIYNFKVTCYSAWNIPSQNIMKVHSCEVVRVYPIFGRSQDNKDGHEMISVDPSSCALSNPPRSDALVYSCTMSTTPQNKNKGKQKGTRIPYIIRGRNQRPHKNSHFVLAQRQGFRSTET